MIHCFGVTSRRAMLLLLFSGPAGVAASAQSPRAARPASTPVGEVGQRQTREEAAPGIEPMARIDARVPNRVQSRIRNRIDRFYDPLANAASPFAIAGDQARVRRRTTPR